MYERYLFSLLASYILDVLCLKVSDTSSALHHNRMLMSNNEKLLEFKTSVTCINVVLAASNAKGRTLLCILSAQLLTKRQIVPAGRCGQGYRFLGFVKDFSLAARFWIARDLN